MPATLNYTLPLFLREGRSASVSLGDSAVLAKGGVYEFDIRDGTGVSSNVIMSRLN